MKKYFKLLMVALFATLSFTLTSCGDDDDDAADAIVGTWMLVDNYGDTYTYTFNSNGTMTYVETYGSNHQYTDQYTGTYQISGDVKKGATLTCNLTDIEDPTDPMVVVAIVRIDGNLATVSYFDGDDLDDVDIEVFTRVK